MSDSEIAYDSDQNVSERHSKLIESVAQLDNKQRIKNAVRSEPTLVVSEHTLVKSGIADNDVLRVQDLAKSLKQKGYARDIIKKLRSVQQKTKVLSKPLEKPVAERIKRKVGYQNTKKDLGKWNAIIAKNRTAEHLFFPLSNSKETVKVASTTEFLKRFRLQSDLQKKLEEVNPVPQVSSKVEEENEIKMTLQEVILKRREAAKLRAQKSYEEAKAHRERKIKSKKYHRIQRKEKIKQQLKEFEELQRNNPQEALAKLEQLDKSRAKERMSLRHKNTGQWAKNKQIKAKYDKEARQVLAEQLSISKELTQKIRRTDDSENENEEIEESLVLSNNDKENPWVNNVKTRSEINEFVESYRKFWDKKNTKLEEKTVTDSNDEIEERNQINESKNNSISCINKKKRKLGTTSKVKKIEKKKQKNQDYLPNLEFKQSKQKPILDLSLEETIFKKNLQKNTDPMNLKITKTAEQESACKLNDQSIKINLQKYPNIKPQYLETQLPDMDTGGDELDNSEPEEETNRIMSEAFADDDNVKEFRKEKEEEIKKSQPEDIDLSLPGWGNWAGTNIKKSKVSRKKRQFILKFPKDTPRKDENKGDVIIFEGDDRKLKKHLVSELPYPFTSVKDFEASIRAPLGRTFIPEKAHIQLIQPMINTKLGQVIEPMNEDVLVKKPTLKRHIRQNKKELVKKIRKKNCK